MDEAIYEIILVTLGLHFGFGLLALSRKGLVPSTVEERENAEIQVFICEQREKVASLPSPEAILGLLFRKT